MYVILHSTPDLTRASRSSIRLIIFTSQDHVMAVPINPKIVNLLNRQRDDRFVPVVTTSGVTIASPVAALSIETPAVKSEGAAGNTAEWTECDALETNIPELTPMYLFKKRTAKALIRLLNPFRRRVAPEGHVSYSNGVGIIYLCCGMSWFQSCS
jgi:hypothetical protein